MICALVAIGIYAETDRPRGRERIEKEVRHELVMLPYYSPTTESSIAWRTALMATRSLYSAKCRGRHSRVTLGESSRGLKASKQWTTKSKCCRCRSTTIKSGLPSTHTIYGDATLRRYASMAVPSIHIVVKNGNVTLDGAVDREGDKNNLEKPLPAVEGIIHLTPY